MPTPTYIPLATKTLTATATSVTFSSISQAYRDLVLIGSGFRIVDGGSAQIGVRVNALATSIYSQVSMGGDGSTATSVAATNTQLLPSNPSNLTNTSPITTMEIDFLDYSVTDKHKSGVYRYNNSSTFVIAGAFRIATTEAVSTLAVFPMASSFPTGTSFTLYGIAS